MKKLFLLAILTLFDIECMYYVLNSCPTCVGNAQTSRAPFFCDENYQDTACVALDFQETSTQSIMDE